MLRLSLSTWCSLRCWGCIFRADRRPRRNISWQAEISPGWVVGFSILGTIVSSASFVGHPGNVFHKNMYMIPMHIVPLFVMLFVARYLVVFYRHTLKMTVYAYLEKRFGYPARAYGAGAFLLSRVTDVSVTYYFLAIAAAYLTGWDVGAVILVLGIITVLYTLLGGIQAVVWTDVIQGLLLIGGGLLCIAIVLLQSTVEPTEVIARAWEGGKFEIDRWEFNLFENNQWFYIIGSVVIWVQSFACGQNNVQRNLLARFDKDAVQGAYLGAAACLPVWLLFMLVGALLWSFYQIRAEQLPQDVIEIQDRIVPYFIKTQFPAGLKGLVLAALIAAAMSSLDSDLNAMASIAVSDFYGRFRPQASDRRRLFIGKIAVVLFGVASILLALQWTRIEDPSFVEFMMTMAMIVTGGILGLFALGMLFRWTTARGAHMGILACLLFTLWATLTTMTLPGTEVPVVDMGRFNYSLSPFLIGVLGHVILVLVGLAVSALQRGAPPETTGLTLMDAIKRRSNTD
jgi:SSS family solute:Na+ symporter